MMLRISAAGFNFTSPGIFKNVSNFSVTLYVNLVSVSARRFFNRGPTFLIKGKTTTKTFYGRKSITIFTVSVLLFT